MNNEQLIKRIESLEREVANLKRGNVSFEISNSFQRAGFINGKKLEIPLIFASAGAGMNREIGLTGDPQTITVLDYPYTFLKINSSSLIPDATTGPLGNAFVYIPLYIT